MRKPAEDLARRAAQTPPPRETALGKARVQQHHRHAPRPAGSDEIRPQLALDEPGRVRLPVVEKPGAPSPGRPAAQSGAARAPPGPAPAGVAPEAGGGQGAGGQQHARIGRLIGERGQHGKGGNGLAHTCGVQPEQPAGRPGLGRIPRRSGSRAAISLPWRTRARSSSAGRARRSSPHPPRAAGGSCGPQSWPRR